MQRKATELIQFVIMILITLIAVTSVIKVTELNKRLILLQQDYDIQAEILTEKAIQYMELLETYKMERGY